MHLCINVYHGVHVGENYNGMAYWVVSHVRSTAQ